MNRQRQWRRSLSLCADVLSCAGATVLSLRGGDSLCLSVKSRCRGWSEQHAPFSKSRLTRIFPRTLHLPQVTVQCGSRVARLSPHSGEQNKNLAVDVFAQSLFRTASLAKGRAGSSSLRQSEKFQSQCGCRTRRRVVSAARPSAFFRLGPLAICTDK